MADFYLDTRPRELRPIARVREWLRFSHWLRVAAVETDAFSLAITWSGRDTLWEPHSTESGDLFAVAGVVVFDEQEWCAAEQMAGTGGWAAKAVACRWANGGATALDDLNGNCAVLIYEVARRRLHLRTDPAGAFPVFTWQGAAGSVWCSHPDVLAAATGQTQRLDTVSLAEFVLASTVTPPFTYYQDVRLVEPGLWLTCDLGHGTWQQRRYFRFVFQPAESQNELAEALAEAWRCAVRRRLSPRMGRTAIALSGGLDSRLILASVEAPERCFAFTCYDTPNREVRTAKTIAQLAGIPHHLFLRPADYYADNAESGVRVSGGMGTLANNHFLGALEWLHDLGANTLLTGCYCDYLFKGLPLNRKTHWLTGWETLAPFEFGFYFERRLPDTPLARQVRERWESYFPTTLRQASDDAALFALEARRTFPVSYEGDNQQRLVPQRLMAWSPPVLDGDLLRLYQRIPSRWKLNRHLFSYMTRCLLRDSPLWWVPDANTGALLQAGPLLEVLAYNRVRLQRRFLAWRRRLDTDGSWPNWRYYYRHSPGLARLWARGPTEADAFFCEVLHRRTLPATPRGFPPNEVFLFVALLTLKLWWRVRIQ